MNFALKEIKEPQWPLGGITAHKKQNVYKEVS